MKRVILIAVPIGIFVGLTVARLALTNNFALPIVIMYLFLFTAVFPIARKLIKGHFDTFEAENFFIIPFTLYSLSLPYQIISENTLANEHILALYLAVCLIGLISFLTGYYTKLGKLISHYLRHFTQVNNNQLALGGWFLLGFGLILIFLLMRSAGGLFGYLEMGYGGKLYLYMRGRGYLAYGFYFYILALFILFISCIGMRERLRFILTAIFAIIFITFEFRMGARSAILNLLIGLLVIFHYGVKRIRPSLAIIAIMVVYIGGVMFAHARSELPFGISHTLSFMIRNLSFKLLSPISIGEFIAPSQALWELLENGVTRIPYQFGMSYLRIPLIMIPLVLFPTRPLALAEWRVATFYPEVYQSGGGLGFFTLAEGFINFSFAGAILHMFLYGLFARATYEYFRTNYKNKANLLLYATILPWVVLGIRIDTAPIIKTLLLAYIIPTLIILMFSREIPHFVQNDRGK